MKISLRGKIKISGAILGFASLGAGFVPNFTSTETSKIDWDDVVAVDLPKVRVRLAGKKRSVTIEGENIKVQNEWAGLLGPITYHKLGARVLWIGGSQRLAELPLTQPLKISGSNLFLGDMRLPHSLELQARADGFIDVIAGMALEKYVEGVVAGEMPSSWPLEALKTQAVAARSYILSLRRAQKNKTFDVDSSQFDQVYRAIEALPKSSRDQIKRAVDESQGLVLRRDSEYPLATYFHSDCGGQTEKASTIWGNTKSKQVGPSCPFKPGNPWTFKVSKAQFSKLFHLRSVVSLKPKELSGSGRVVNLEAVSITGYIQSIPSSQLRKILGYSNLKSTLFEVVELGDALEFRGHGFGHGVGLCQWGSKYMAEHGSNFMEILAHYYPRSRIVPISRGLQIGQRK